MTPPTGVFDNTGSFIGSGILYIQPLRILNSSVPLPEQSRQDKINQLNTLREACQKLERELIEDGISVSDEFELGGRL